MRSAKCGCTPAAALGLVSLLAAWMLPLAGCGLMPTVPGEQATTPLRGDVNGDGVVDQMDLDLAIGAFGAREGDALFVPAADLNEDGVIGLDDLQTLADILSAQ
jgi:hypothetical protein